jgi:DNA-directed RNA polymerase subunit RPC12/RpoP
MANKRDSGYVTTMVCVTCGAEQFFDDAVPVSLTCPKCQSTVFREFTTPTSRDDAVVAQLEEQARSISYGDSSPGTAPDDVRDLEST